MDICVWEKCNNRCIICTNPDGPWKAWDGSLDYGFASLKERILKNREKFIADDTIYLTGGEPTIHFDFLKLLDFLVGEFPEKKIILLTNGRRFFYEDFAKKMLEKCQNIEIHLSLYGHNKATHEKTTQARGSFEQSLSGLKNLLKNKNSGQIIAVRHVLSSISYRFVDNFLKIFNGELINVNRVILMFWEIEEQAEKNIKYLKLSYNDVSPYLKNVNSFQEKIREIRLYHFPLCQIKKELWHLAWRTWPEYEIDFLDTCSDCKVKKYCVGIHKAYLKNIGSTEFKAVKTTGKIKESSNAYKPIKSID
jgi:MoaA/NifB/PqqE/SkfB family radical SAM enzyme